MPLYRNLNGNSGVHSYELGGTEINPGRVDDPEWIEVRFMDGMTYRYTRKRLGDWTFDVLVGHARVGQGLNAYINTTPAVKFGYEHKWRS